ncbi:hypothetical protein [Kitasatospora purpeofusca]|uniref:hypothetical protein n=1 Tax=Kitasatospora purpeofusca TaxID=67352 RepID=UPI003F4AD4C3
MDRRTYTAELAALRELRTEITAAEKQVAAAQKELDRLTAQRSRKVAGLAGYEGAQAPAVAKASGLSVGDVVRIAPLLDPTPAAVRAARTDDPAAAAPAPAPVPAHEPAAGPTTALAPALTRPAPSRAAGPAGPGTRGVERGRGPGRCRSAHRLRRPGCCACGARTAGDRTRRSGRPRHAPAGPRRCRAARPGRFGRCRAGPGGRGWSA